LEISRLPSLTRGSGIVIEHVVGAHALIWMLEGNPRLGANARAVFTDPASRLLVPVIALAEACWVVN
jgi:PIN domain nuclease of toxin-antitoxin system